MKNVEFLYLSQQDILDLNISWDKIIERVEIALKEHGEGTVENPPKPGAHSRPNCFIHAMPAYLQQMDAVGMKWVSGYPTNHSHGLPSILGLQIMNCPETGVPTAVMDCTWITAVRTAAVSAVSAKYCARQNSEVLGVVGAGVQGRMNTYALKHILPSIKTVKVFDVFDSATAKFKEEMSKELGVEVIVCDTTEKVARDSDVIVTTIPRTDKPVDPAWMIRTEWLKEGVTGLPVDGTRAWVESCIFGASKFLTDDLGQTTHYHETQGVFPNGMPPLYAEIGEVVAGKKTGRDSDAEFIMAMNFGLAIEDISMGKYILELATQKGVGTKLPL
ncbi:MAG: ornithine cyclodeaminase family protein [Desulfovibrionales bacterium]|nr:ornithine cyclodeaminase family protein [Desulfovibrionales bacterium]